MNDNYNEYNIRYIKLLERSFSVRILKSLPLTLFGFPVDLLKNQTSLNLNSTES